MKLVEEVEGAGELTWRGESVGMVNYSLSRFQAMTAGGLPVPGLHRIEGRLELASLPTPHSVSADIEGEDVLLKLDDGRTMRLTVADRDGRVLAEGHGPSKCGCC